MSSITWAASLMSARERLMRLETAKPARGRFRVGWPSARGLDPENESIRPRVNWMPWKAYRVMSRGSKNLIPSGSASHLARGRYTRLECL